MRNLWKAFLASCVVVSVAASAAAQQSSAIPAERLIRIAPCRLVDTRLNAPADAIEETARKFDVASTRCGKFVPTVATAYAMRITSYDRANEGKVPPQAIAVQPDLTRHPAGPLITFPIPSGTHITVDLEGYYVPPNTPTDPIPQASQTNGVTVQSTGASNAASTGTPLRPKAQVFHDGNVGEFYLDGSRYWPSGLFGASTSTASPWVTFMSGRSDGTDGFGVYNSNFSELMRVSSNGPIRLTQSWSYLSGRFDYRETPNIVNNVVSEIQIINPRDAAGGATSRVTFYDATSNDEYNSPPTTKFRAFTNGIQAHPDINFDSQIGYSFPNSPEYYYRAYSQVEGIETFWLKAATNSDAYHNTRADMYVSGLVGIGTTAPATQLDVRDAVYAGARLTAVGQQASVLRGGYNAVYYSEMASYIPTGAPGVDSIGWKIRPYYYGRGGLFDAVTITPTGKVGIGIEPTALLQLAPPAGTAGFSQSANGNFLIDASGISGGRMAILEDGRVGIGTNNPAAGTRLDVAGNAHFGGNVDVGGVIYAKYQDVAEWVPATQAMAAGTVVVLNPQHGSEVMPSGSAYDTSVAGVVSAQPGLILGERSSTKEMIATTGRVKVRVDARRHPVKVGDLLVTSDVPGTAMRSEPIDVAGIKLHRPGTLIGKALEPLASGIGEILVLLSLQ